MCLPRPESDLGSGRLFGSCLLQDLGLPSVHFSNGEDFKYETNAGCLNSLDKTNEQEADCEETSSKSSDSSHESSSSESALGDNDMFDIPPIEEQKIPDIDKRTEFFPKSPSPSAISKIPVYSLRPRKQNLHY